MKSLPLFLGSVAALGVTPENAMAQQPMTMSMPGTTMPAHPKAKSDKPTNKKSTHKKVVKTGAHKRARPAHQAEQPTHDSKRMTMPMDQGTKPMPSTGGTMSMPMPQQPAPGDQMPMPMGDQRAGHMGNMPMSGMQHGGVGMTTTGTLGSYPMAREASGTSWQPDNSAPMGPMVMSGDWMLMAGGVLNLVYDHQSGPRGDDKAFASGMLMGMAQRPLGNGTVQFKAMVSPDPLMGPGGYPLLLASGETANGRDRLIDRQHPHDFFMELAASMSQNVAPRSSLFLYAGLPGEPAFGPPAFMHRESIMDSPEAPISHHWLDSTHISFGVVTAGIVAGRVKFEASRFNGREPDQHRWDIETGPLDSTALRLSWNPTSTLALQASWGDFTDPEQLEPGVDQKRLSVSTLYARDIAPGWKFGGTLAWGRKTAEGGNDDAYVAEASLKHRGWTMFGRAEMVDNRELVAGVENGPACRVGKISVGAIRDFRIASHLSLGAGGLFALDFVPQALAPSYGGNNPSGAMGFVRLKLN